VFWVRSTVEATMKKGSRGRNGDKDEEDDIVEQGATGSTEKRGPSRASVSFHSLGKARAGACKDTCPARIALGLVHEMRPENRVKYERAHNKFKNGWCV
jgi:hypothetical protein